MSLDISLTDVVETEVFDANITHNLAPMADAAGVYGPIWRPEENGITTASQMISPLLKALGLLESDPPYFQAFNPENGWGSYDGFVVFIKRYLEACIEHPNAKISAWR